MLTDLQKMHKNHLESIGNYLKNYYFFPAVVFLIILLLLLSLSICLQIISPLFFLLILIMLAIKFVDKQLQHIAMLEFAGQNGLHYQKNKFFIENGGFSLKLGQNQITEDKVAGKINEFPFVFFNFSSTLVKESAKQNIGFTVCQIQSDAKLPRFFLAANNPVFEPSILAKDQVEIQLEGDFHKYFKLYVTKEYEIEALQIFTPDIMAKLIDKFRDYSLEFASGQLFIYSKQTARKIEDLNTMLDLAKILVEELKITLERMK